MEARWYSEDPRETISKRGMIVILRRGDKGWESLIGQVEVKNDWCIFISGLSNISHGDKWDKDWLWTRFPEVR